MGPSRTPQAEKILRQTQGGLSPLPSLTPSPQATPDYSSVKEALIAGRVFRLEVAVTPQEKARGLMDRPSLPEDAAMLFVYERDDYLIFWMKNTLIPLDILFLDGNAVVVDVQTMHPQPGTPDDLLRRYRSARPARFAIEMNAGLAERYRITAGSQVEFRP